MKEILFQYTEVLICYKYGYFQLIVDRDFNWQCRSVANALLEITNLTQIRINGPCNEDVERNIDKQKFEGWRICLWRSG